MMRQSIRLRMMLLFCLVVGVLLGCSYLGLYMLFAGIIRDQGDRRLVSTANPIIADLILDPEEKDVDKLDIPDVYFEVLDSSLHVLQRSINLQSRAIPFPSSSIGTNQAVFSDAFERGYGALRVAVVPFTLGAEKRFLVVAAPPRDADEALLTFRRLMFVLFPVSLLLTAAVSSWYTHRSLRPVTELTQHAARLIEGLPHRTGADVRSLPVRNAEDEVGLLATTFNELFARLDAVMQQLRQFVSDASHELRTPLAVLQGETELVLSRARTPADYQRALGIIDEELKKLSRIVDGLFTLSMADAGHLPIAREPLYVEEVLEETCALALPMAQTKHISMDREFERDVAFLGDAAFLRQLFLIFIDNAIKYSPPGSRLSIRLATEDHHVRIQFQDQGIGIAPEHIAQIFERFFRVAQPNGAETQSGGLGLSIAQAIVQAHRGRVECESVPGVGSLFTVHLPIATAVSDEQELIKV